MADGRCAYCRRGHYAMPGGTVTNFPCTTEGCACTYCWPERARLAEGTADSTQGDTDG